MNNLELLKANNMLLGYHKNGKTNVKTTKTTFLCQTTKKDFSHLRKVKATIAPLFLKVQLSIRCQ